MSKYSQFEEEETLEEIFNGIGTTNKFFVEIGCLPDGRLSNTMLLKERGWIGHWFDMNDGVGIIKEFITAENINEVLGKYSVPLNLDLLSIDVDGNDYHILKALVYEPRVLIIEYNEHKESGVSEYVKDYVWDGRSRNFGTSKKDMVELAESKGYTLIKTTTSNLIFVCKNL